MEAHTDDFADESGGHRAPQPLLQARESGLQLHPSSAALVNTAADPRGTPPFLIEVLWAQRHQLDLPGTVNYLLQSLDALKRQSLSPMPC